MNINPTNYTKLLRVDLIGEEQRQVRSPAKRQPISKLSPSTILGSPNQAAQLSTAATLKEQVPQDGLVDPIIQLAVNLNRSKSRQSSKNRPTRKRGGRLACSVGTPNRGEEEHASEQEKISRALERWPCGLIRAARRTKVNECEKTAQGARTALLLKGLQQKIPSSMMLLPKHHRQNVKSLEPRRTGDRSALHNSDDESSSDQSVSSYLGIRLKLRKIEVSQVSGESSSSFSGSITPPHMKKTYSNMLDDSHLFTPMRSQTIEESSHLQGHKTPRATKEMARTLKEIIDENPTGLRSSLARKFFQDLMSAVYFYHKVEKQPHCDIRSGSILVSHTGTLTLGRPNDRVRHNADTFDSVRYLPPESLTKEQSGIKQQELRQSPY